MPFVAGTTVGQYRIMEQLGQGGMATVYKAYHASLDRYVAIKVLHQAFLEDPTFQARFQREARLVARLEHPNIVPIYDYAEHEGQPYLVMKFIEGDTLKAYITQGKLSPGDVLKVMEAIGAGLSYAHKQGILHRDIKPSNVIMAADGGIYLADFGLARIAQSGESTLSSDSVLGTPQYISPEQAMSKKDLDEGTDIYSFGVMLYEMTVGKVPFSADTPFSVIHDHIYAPLPLPSSVNPRVSPALERVLLKALAKDRADRYVDVTALVTAFKEAWSDQLTTQSLPVQDVATPAHDSAALTQPPAPKPLPEQAKVSVSLDIDTPKKFNWLWLLPLVLVCLCLAAAAFFFLRNRPGNPPQLPMTQPVAPVVETPVLPELPTPEVPVEAPLELVPEEMPDERLSEEEARKLVEKSPRLPKAHLQLGLALLRGGKATQGYDEIRLAGELAKKQARVLFGMALTLDKQGYPLGALMMHLHLFDLPQVPRQVVTQELHRTAYYGYTDPVSSLVLEFNTIEKTDPFTSEIARIRHAQGPGNDLEKAARVLDAMSKTGGEIPEVRLLRAVQFVLEGNPDAARPLLEQLSQDAKLPQWIRSEADELLRKIK